MENLIVFSLKNKLKLIHSMLILVKRIKKLNCLKNLLSYMKKKFHHFPMTIKKWEKIKKMMINQYQCDEPYHINNID